jgi:hypothetical protein
MTDDRSSTSGRGALGTAGVWLLVVSLVVAAFLLGRVSEQSRGHGDRARDTFVEDPAKRTIVEEQLANAKKIQRWDSDQQRSFENNVAQLSRKSQYELSGELAELINTNALIIHREPSPHDPSEAPNPGVTPAGKREMR